MTINSTLYACFLTFCFGFTVNTAFAQIQDGVIDDPGDIAFVAYVTGPTNGMAGFAFVFLDNCPNNQAIVITDEEWTGSAFASIAGGGGEGELTWTNTTGTTIARGTVIKFAGPVGASNIAWTSANCSVNIGTLSGFFNTINLANGDQLFAITGTRASPTTFLAFVGGITTTGLAFDGTNLGTGTQAGGNIVLNSRAVNITTGSKYTGSTVCNGTAVACGTMINTSGSWGSTGSLADASAFFAAIPNSFTGSVLPLELTAFDVQNTEGSKNNLTWITASEKNNSHFDIERSTDGNTFHNIGQVKGNNKPSSYQFIDNQPFATSYYRLRQIDFDGTETVSKIISVELKGKTKGLKIYPTLVSNGILTVNTEGGQLDDFSVTNLLGQQVLVGKTTTQIDVSSLSKGTYVLKVGTEVAKFIKQ